jgi:hypothetical protein
MKKLGNLVAAGGTYETASGEQKTRWIRCGVALETDKGIRLKLESLPVGVDWDGWLSVFEETQEQPNQPARVPGSTTDPSPSIPF